MNQKIPIMNFTLTLLIICLAATAAAEDLVYNGTWKTTNRPLNGNQTAIVTKLDKNEKGVEQWQVRFYGVWQGVDYDYTVRASGPTDNIQGKATIDFAHYNWEALLTDDVFKANFNGSRYKGSFDMKRVKKN